MIWVVFGVAVALAVGFFLLRRARRKRSRMISIVGLVNDHTPFDPAVLARAANTAWNTDVGDGATEGPDGFIAGTDIISTVMHRGRMYIIHTFPRPYSEDVDAAADGIRDPRIRDLYRGHTAWFSCDALGVDGTTPEEEVRGEYRKVGKLFAELLDDNCRLIFLPDAGLAYPVNDETTAALRSDDPAAELQETMTVPMVQVDGDDPLMVAAVAKARERWPEFCTAFDAGAGENFSIKAPVTGGGNTEFIWISVTAIEGERVYGTLGNEPADLGKLKLGSKVSVAAADLNDWGYLDSAGEFVGGFTVEAMGKIAKRDRKKKAK